MFSRMMHQIREGVTEYLFKVQIEEGSEFPTEQNQSKKVVEHRGASSEEPKPLTVRRDEKKWLVDRRHQDPTRNHPEHTSPVLHAIENGMSRSPVHAREPHSTRSLSR